ncbi:porin [Massilia sp. SYSU DXS3249]
MNKCLIAGLVGACFAIPAAAETSVQIYGIADAGVLWQKGGPTKIVSGGADGSRIGFKGTEDIGNGFKAIFNLEARVELDTGTQQPTLINDNRGLYLERGLNALNAFSPLIAPGLRAALYTPGAPAVNQERALFDRTAMVGLITPVGAVLLGRMYTPGYEVFAAADAFESGMVGTWGHVTGGTAGFTALGADIRSQESVQYRIAHPSGFGGSVMYGKQGSGYLGRYSKFQGGALTYKANGFDIGIGYNQGFDQRGFHSLRTRTIGGSYTLNQFKFFAGFHDQRNQNSALIADYLAAWDARIAPALAAAPAPIRGAARATFEGIMRNNTFQDASSYQIGLHYKLGSGRIMASAAHQNDLTASNSDANMYALAYDHFLSKRTDLYIAGSVIRNDNEAQYSPGISGSPGGFTRAPGEDGRAVQIGVRHRF